ncbi:MAG: flagellar biosynthesis protein FlhA [Myxococcota bacterium]
MAPRPSSESLIATASPAPSFLQRMQSNGDYLLAASVLGLLVIMLAPLPAWLLDILLAGSIGLSLLLFLTTLNAKRPVDFSLFPSLLLVATVFRLALNVASTRLILLGGHEGTGAAGQIIRAFGQFVVGGSFAVGLVVFTILVLINFVVITKGAGRVAEVAARFTLDALPGKQMAIDAELNAGLIDEDTARSRRAAIAREADFYGSMDGASKFVRGDAIAGIVITVVNVLGGMFIGMAQQGLTIMEAAEVYTILTIGDGLVGQVPALIVSTAAGLLVTRVDEPDDAAFHSRFGTQLFSNPRVLIMAAVVLGAFAFVPGLTIPFLIVSGLVAWLAYTRWQAEKRGLLAPAEAPPTAAEDTPASPDDLLIVEPLTIEVGVDLLYLVDERQGGELLQRVQRTRNQFAQDLGVVLPSVHLRDNLRHGAGDYSILLRGEVIGTASLHARKHLALNPGNAIGTLKGVKTIDPVFGLESTWIADAQVLDAQAKGYTVVDVPTVLITHFVELMQRHAHELFDQAQLQKVLDRVSETHGKLVDDLIPDPLPRSVVLRVFRGLIREGISTRDTHTILDALADYATKTRDPDDLTELVRQRMSRHITRRFADEDGTLHYVGLGRDAEQALLRGLQRQEGGGTNLVLDPRVAQTLFEQVQLHTESYSGSTPAVVLAPPLARGALRRMLERVLPQVVVLSSAELLPTVTLAQVGVIELNT